MHIKPDPLLAIDWSRLRVGAIASSRGGIDRWRSRSREWRRSNCEMLAALCAGDVMATRLAGSLEGLQQQQGAGTHRRSCVIA